MKSCVIWPMTQYTLTHCNFLFFFKSSWIFVLSSCIMKHAGPGKLTTTIQIWSHGVHSLLFYFVKGVSGLVLFHIFNLLALFPSTFRIKNTYCMSKSRLCQYVLFQIFVKTSHCKKVWQSRTLCFGSKSFKLNSSKSQRTENKRAVPSFLLMYIFDDWIILKDCTITVLTEECSRMFSRWKLMFLLILIFTLFMPVTFSF